MREGLTRYAAPRELLRGTVITAQGLGQVLEGIDLRWRLDAMLAVTGTSAGTLTVRAARIAADIRTLLRC